MSTVPPANVDNSAVTTTAVSPVANWLANWLLSSGGAVTAADESFQVEAKLNPHSGEQSDKPSTDRLDLTQKVAAVATQK